jgi:hypothetical protein
MRAPRYPSAARAIASQARREELTGEIAHVVVTWEKNFGTTCSMK